MMKNQDIDYLMKELKETVKSFDLPSVSFLKVHGATPFLILVSTIISLRTKDEVTLKAAKKLFEIARTPEEIISLGSDKIEQIIYPAGFYKTKAKTIVDISKDIITKFKGKVPDEIEELLKLKGVGRKTANLVLSVGYNKNAICVDTHVHRISNRLGYVKTKNADETEFALRDKLPTKYWIKYNDYLVAFGQNVCKPINPLCEICQFKKICTYYQNNYVTE